MAYFPHAFQKMLVATNATPFKAGTAALTGTLPAGQVAVVNALTNQTIDIAATPVYGAGAGQFNQVYLAQGSFHRVDKLGPFHGGYQETVKSKGINPKYVSEFYVVEPSNPVNDVVEVSQAGCIIKCDTIYDLRVDVKGSPALRFLTHNLYQTLSVNTGCCTVTGTTNDPKDPNIVLLGWADQINGTGLANGTLGGNNSIPFLNQFIRAKVWNKTTLAPTGTASVATSTITLSAVGTGANAVAAGDKLRWVIGGIVYAAYVASLAGSVATLVQIDGVTPYVHAVAVPAGTNVKAYKEIVSTGANAYVPVTPVITNGVSSIDSNIDIYGAYVDTQFGNASFDPNDHFEKEPVYIYASVAAHANNSNDLGGSTCDATCFVSNETQLARQGKGFGETIIRELILDKRYRQEPWYQDPRMREVMDDSTLSYIDAAGNLVAGEVNRGTKYSAYYILHSVPRKSNSDGTLDNDQYLVKIVTPSRSAATAVNFEAWWNAFLASANTGVALKVVK
jgi:hypothetical protein